MGVTYYQPHSGAEDRGWFVEMQPFWRALARWRVFERGWGMLITPSGARLGGRVFVGGPSRCYFLCAFFYLLIFVSLIHAHDICFWSIRWKNGRQAWRREKSVGREAARLMFVQTVRFAICVSPPVLISLSHSACTWTFPRLELRPILILINCIDTCSYPIACNNPTAWPRLYCIIRKCSLTQELENDSLLTVIFQIHVGFRQKKKAALHLLERRRWQVVRPVSFHWPLIGLYETWRLCPQHRSVHCSLHKWRNLPCPNLDFWVYPLLWPWVPNIRNYELH